MLLTRHLRRLVCKSVQAPSQLPHQSVTPFHLLKRQPIITTHSHHQMRPFSLTKPLGMMIKFCFSNSSGENFQNSKDAIKFKSIEAEMSYFQAMKEYFESDNITKSLALLQKTVELEPGNLNLLLDISEYFHSEGDFQKSLSFQLQALKLATGKVNVSNIVKGIWKNHILLGDEAATRALQLQYPDVLSSQESVNQKHILEAMRKNRSIFASKTDHYKGQMFYEEGEPEKAIKYFEKVLHSMGRIEHQYRVMFLPSLQQLHSLYPQDQTESIIHCLERTKEISDSIGTPESESESLRVDALIDYFKSNYHSALKKFLELREKGKQNSYSHFKVIECYNNLNQAAKVVEESRSYITKYGEKEKDDLRILKVWRFLTLGYYYDLKFMDALLWAKKLETKLADQEDNLGLKLIIGNIYVNLQQYQKGLEYYTTIINDPKCHRQLCILCLESRAFCYYTMKLHSQAITDLTRIVNEFPEYHDMIVIFHNRAHNYLELKQYPESFKDLETMLAIDKDYEPAKFMQGRVYIETGETEKAKQRFELLQANIDKDASTLPPDIREKVGEYLKLIQEGQKKN